MILEGRGGLHGLLRKPEVLSDLEADLRAKWLSSSPFVWLDRLQNLTRGAIDLENRSRSGDFVAGLLDQFDSLKSGLPEKEAEIREKLAPVYEKKLVKKYLQPPDEEQLRQLLEMAQELCLDYLIGEQGES